MKIYRIKSIILILGDLTLFYIGLILTLFLRYGPSEFEKWWEIHLLPFSALFAIWLSILAISGFYNILSFSAKQKISESVIRVMLFSGAVSMAVFYFWPQTTITPKTNLLINISLTAALLIVWRKIYAALIAKTSKTRIVFLGWSKETRELSNLLRNSPHLGYEPIAVILPENYPQTADINLPIFIFSSTLPKTIIEKKIELIIASLDVRSNTNFIKMLYEILPSGIAYLNFTQFYERMNGKIPVSMINEMWFLENLAKSEKRIFEAAKRTFDIFAGTVLGIAALLFLPAVAFAIKLESPGPIFFRQRRVGKNGKIFELIKFRSKTHDGKQIFSGWNKEEDEKRNTLVGKILRKSYIDELPQALNIIKGEMSLIGPRPERQEFVDELKEQIPHYMMRLLVRPGISGWAQINMKYDASAADALEKLQYDLYYIKNRSLGLDISISLKTLFTMISHPGK